MIEVHDLTKNYGAVTAVKGVTFAANPGQVTGFLGPNGAGKTTTMRILTGFLPPTAGKATVAGFDVFDQSMQVRQHVGYLPESVPLYRDMTTLGYLMYIAEIRGVKQRRDRAMDVLKRVALEHRANSHIRALSKGMRQRVGLAQALIHDPEVLILDEPTIGLDPIQVMELRDLVRDLGHDHTVLFSTHILSEAEQVCDKVVIIHQGNIVAQGAPLELRTHLERGGRILVRVDTPIDEVLPVIQNIPEVNSAEAAVDGIIVTPDSADIDPRPAIARAVVERGWNLMELRPAAVNLEEIFLELTRADQQAEVSDIADDSFSEAEVANG